MILEIGQSQQWYVGTLIMAHFYGDWYFQSREMAHKKSSSIKMLLQHLFLVALPLGFFIICLRPERIKLLPIYLVIHGVQDWFLWRGYKADHPDPTFEYWKDKRFYDLIAIDQGIHLITIIALFT